MLQSQYEFIHNALCEWIMCGKTEIEIENLQIKLQQLQTQVSGSTLSGYLQQYQVYCIDQL